jgi:hypothetical protein
MKSVKWTTYHHNTAILHDTFFNIRKFISACEVMLLFCFFYRASSFFVESCGPSTDILEPRYAGFRPWPLTNVLLHPYLPDVSSSRFCFIASYTKRQLVILHWRVGTLQCISGRFRAAVTHLQSLTTGLCPGTRQFTYFRRFSIIILCL